MNSKVALEIDITFVLIRKFSYTQYNDTIFPVLLMR